MATPANPRLSPSFPTTVVYHEIRAKLPKVPLKEIENPHDHDVLCGRGGLSNNHIGNTHWRTLVSANKRLYISLPKKQKMLVAQSIVRAVRSQNPPGRFLQREDNSGLWCDIGDQKAQDKTSQALREGAPELRTDMEKEKEIASNQRKITSNTSSMPLETFVGMVGHGGALATASVSKGPINGQRTEDIMRGDPIQIMPPPLVGVESAPVLQNAPETPGLKSSQTLPTLAVSKSFIQQPKKSEDGNADEKEHELLISRSQAQSEEEAKREALLVSSGRVCSGSEDDIFSVPITNGNSFKEIEDEPGDKNSSVSQEPPDTELSTEMADTISVMLEPRPFPPRHGKRPYNSFGSFESSADIDNMIPTSQPVNTSTSAPLIGFASGDCTLGSLVDSDDDDEKFLSLRGCGEVGAVPEDEHNEELAKWHLDDFGSSPSDDPLPTTMTAPPSLRNGQSFGMMSTTSSGLSALLSAEPEDISLVSLSISRNVSRSTTRATSGGGAPVPTTFSRNYSQAMSEVSNDTNGDISLATARSNTNAGSGGMESNSLSKSKIK